jgi:predicted HAD superfamily Cof-like phosphohydrolase
MRRVRQRVDGIHFHHPLSLHCAQSSIDTIMSAQDQQLIQDVDSIIAALETTGCFNDWIATTAVFNAVHGANHDDIDVCTVDCFCCWTGIGSLFE